MVSDPGRLEQPEGTEVRWAAHAAVLGVLLSVLAVATPTPIWPTDKDFYLRIGREFLIPGCSDIHCFRVLVPWVIERLPGTSIVWWKAYAVACETAAAVIMGMMVVRMGATARVATQVMWLTAFGYGSCYTLFDPHTSDPLIHLLAPALMLLLLSRRTLHAGVLAAIGIFAKEFALAPVAIFGVWRALQGRRAEAVRAIVAASIVGLTWAAWQLGLRSMLDYSHAATTNEILGGGHIYVIFWLRKVGPALALSSVVLSLGVLWVLWPAGFVWGPREVRQLTFAATPAIVVLCAMQQPDRALWNFAFIIMPAAAVVLNRISAPLGWFLVAAHLVANLRVGAQLSFVPPARVTLTTAALVALAAVWAARTTPRRPAVTA
jgi:hypothetical protein